MNMRSIVLATTILAAVAVCPQAQETELTEEQVRLNLESFDVVWTTINEKHFDTTFSGLDWEALRDELRPKVAEAATMAEARSIMRKLIFSLGLSHFNIIPENVYRNIDGPARKGDLGGVAGLETRVLNGRAVVFRVHDGSSAQAAGIRPGWEIVDINGEYIPDLFPPIMEEFEDNMRLDAYLAQAVESRLGGKVGDTVRVKFLNADDTPVVAMLELTEPRGKKIVFGNLPPFYLRTKTDTLPSGIGYFRFNCFFDPATLMPTLAEAVKGFPDEKGMILDLRGNPGGIGALAIGVTGWFVSEKNLYLGTLSTPETQLKLIVNPRPQSFTGPLAVLIDGLSGSSAEFLSGGLKDLGRARIFGTNTVGAALPSVFEILPNGDRFQYVQANYVSRGGERLEGNGVAPHESVLLTREALLDGRDPVLEAAEGWILQQQDM